ncbi:Papain family cysteine protease [Aphelenchoides besseyi]|nr:Papain family cysteine protease [Aphelenchoides besseyi]
MSQLSTVFFLLAVYFVALEAAKEKKACDAKKGGAKNPSELTGKALVDYINKHATWKAEFRKQFVRTKLADLKKLAGVKPDTLRVYARESKHQSDFAPQFFSRLSESDLPKEFDSRKQWPECSKHINIIADQSSCGHISSTSALSDRFCISSRGKIQVELSAFDLVSCCTECGTSCIGGYPIRAYNYMQEQGVVTGGSNYTEKRGCLSYPYKNERKEKCRTFQLIRSFLLSLSLSTDNHYCDVLNSPCEHGNGDEIGNFPVCFHRSYKPTCQRKCSNKKYANSFDEDKYYALDSYTFNNNPISVQKELYTNGPLVFTALRLYTDFLYYRSGVYEHKAGRFLGLHAVRVIGWGEEKGVPYWLVANSWNEDWGDKGLFKIKRGTNECGIESVADVGIPDLERSANAPGAIGDEGEEEC